MSPRNEEEKGKKSFTEVPMKANTRYGKRPSTQIFPGQHLFQMRRSLRMNITISDGLKDGWMRKFNPTCAEIRPYRQTGTTVMR